MARHHAFEWDDEKAERNVTKHGVRFEDAAIALADPEGNYWHIDVPDLRHTEERWVTLATDPTRRDLILVIAWAPRGNRTRIISARLATRSERRRYEHEIYG